jgi:hypothetical protein
MSAFGKAYSRSTGKQDVYEDRNNLKQNPDGVVITAEQAAQLAGSPAGESIKDNWLTSTPTQNLVADLTSQANSLIESSISLADSNHIIENSKQIIHNLIRVSEIRKLIQTVTSK